MKKVFFIVAMALTVCNAAMAQKYNVNSNDEKTTVDYSFKVNPYVLCKYLDYDRNDVETMEFIIDRFDSDLKRVSISKEEKRYSRLMSAVTYNLSAMRKVLDDNQFRKYLGIFNNTLKNKRIDTVIAQGELAAND